jgi:hypothetical protein
VEEVGAIRGDESEYWDGDGYTVEGKLEARADSSNTEREYEREDVEYAPNGGSEDQ